jgi:hypothetical protein
MIATRPDNAFSLPSQAKSGSPTAPLAEPFQETFV